MKARLIYNLLTKHPYFNALSEADKLSVMNIALTNLYSGLESTISWGRFTDGQVGWDGNILDVDEPYKIPQSEIAQLNLSTYKSVDINLSGNEFLKNYTQEERQVIYNIALSKIASKIPDRYTIQNTTSDLEYYTQNIIDFPVISFEKFALDIQEPLNLLDYPTVLVAMTTPYEGIVYSDFPSVSYDFKLLDAYEEYLYMPKVLVEYELESTAGDRGKEIPEIPYSILDYPSVSIEFVDVIGDTESVITDLTTSGITAKIEYSIFATATDPDFTAENINYSSKPRVIYTKY